MKIKVMKIIRKLRLELHSKVKIEVRGKEKEITRVAIQ